MSHEPDCVFTGLVNHTREQCGGCQTARAAYQRGRDDAASTLLKAAEIDADLWSQTHGTHFVGGSEVIGWTSMWGALNAAVRGNGDR